MLERLRNRKYFCCCSMRIANSTCDNQTVYRALLQKEAEDKLSKPTGSAAYLAALSEIRSRTPLITPPSISSLNAWPFFPLFLPTPKRRQPVRRQELQHPISTHLHRALGSVNFPPFDVDLVPPNQCGLASTTNKRSHTSLRSSIISSGFLFCASGRSAAILCRQRLTPALEHLAGKVIAFTEHLTK